VQTIDLPINVCTWKLIGRYCIVYLLFNQFPITDYCTMSQIVKLQNNYRATTKSNVNNDVIAKLEEEKVNIFGVIVNNLAIILVFSTFRFS